MEARPSSRPRRPSTRPRSRRARVDGDDARRARRSRASPRPRRRPCRASCRGRSACSSTHVARARLAQELRVRRVRPHRAVPGVQADEQRAGLREIVPRRHVDDRPPAARRAVRAREATARRDPRRVVRDVPDPRRLPARDAPLVRADLTSTTTRARPGRTRHDHRSRRRGTAVPSSVTRLRPAHAAARRTSVRRAVHAHAHCVVARAARRSRRGRPTTRSARRRPRDSTVATSTPRRRVRSKRREVRRAATGAAACRVGSYPATARGRHARKAPTFLAEAHARESLLPSAPCS